MLFQLKTTRRHTWTNCNYQHPSGREQLRKNYAGIGYTYDSGRDAFIPPQPYPSWTMSEDTCLWNAPVAMPTEGGPYIWNEEAQTWDAISA